MLPLHQGVGSSGAEDFVLVHLCLDLNWASDRPTVSSLRLSDHPVLLSSLLLLCNSSGASRNWTVGSSDDVNFVWPVVQCTNYTDAMHRWYRRFIWRCKFSSFSQFGMWYFASLGPRNVYKDMLNNMASPIDHVVTNHQNQTRTNVIWGHVHYNLRLFGDLWQHKQRKHKFEKLTKLEPLTLAWMLTIIQIPLRSTSPFSIFFSYVHT
jgi:hypothetical protein